MGSFEGVEGGKKHERLHPIEPAALLAQDGGIFTGRTHAEAYEKFIIVHPQIIGQEPTFKYGFVTDIGDFVERHTAEKIADRTAQVRENARRDPHIGLRSEDLK